MDSHTAYQICIYAYRLSNAPNYTHELGRQRFWWESELKQKRCKHLTSDRPLDLNVLVPQAPQQGINIVTNARSVAILATRQPHPYAEFNSCPPDGCPAEFQIS